MTRFVKRLLAGTCIALGLTPAANAAIWTADKQWNSTYEAGFPEWVRTNFGKDAFHKPEDKALFGLALDCSDAIYAMRIIYAYQNKLPFEINDPRNGRILSNEFTKWDGFREKRRHENDDGTWSTYEGPEYTESDKLRAFIEFIGDITSTLNLVNDTYPVALDDIQPGDMFLLPRNHAYIVKDIDPTGAMTTLSHSSPRAWRVMAEINDFPAEVPEDKSKRDGYRRFKPAEYLRKNPMRVPGASDEQWKIAASMGGDREAFALATQNALASIKEPMGAKAERLFASLCDYTTQRVDIVNQSISYLGHIDQNMGRQCMTFGEYAEHSTPGRDKKLTGQFKLLRSLTQSPDWQNEQFGLKPVIEALFDPADAMSEQELGSYCAIPFDIRGGRQITLREIWRGIEGGRLVADPHAPLDSRWGLSRTQWNPQCESATRS
jgi:hypothetical protein